MKLFQLLLVTLFLAGSACTASRDRGAVMRSDPTHGPTETATPVSLNVDGPYTHENLAIFLVRGSVDETSGKLLTLEEAMSQEKIRVIETGVVAEIAVENRSDDAIYLQAGDVLKGGKQDRVLSQDIVVAPRAARLPVGSFCVDRDRWAQRGDEAVAAFAATSGALPNRRLKLAAKLSGSQDEVWFETSRLSRALARKTGKPEFASPSLALVSEDDDVRSDSAAYTEVLGGCLDGKADVLGLVVVVNGELDSADVYSSPNLFRSLFPRMLRAAAIEALAQSDSEPASTPDADAVAAWLDAGWLIPVAAHRRQPSPLSRTLMGQTDADALFITRDSESNWIHRNLIRK